MSKKRQPTDEGMPEWLMKVLQVGGVLTAIAVVLGSAWWLSSLGVHRISYSRPEEYVDQRAVPADMLAKLDKSRQDEKEFREKEKNGAITAADLPKLQEAIDLQDEYIQRTGQDVAIGNQRLADMRTSLQNYQTNPMRDRSLDLEQQGEEVASKGNNTAAIELYKQAMDLQSKIDDGYPLSKNRDFTRAAKIQHQINFLIAQPLAAESQTDEAAARAALAKQDWGGAQLNFQTAYDLQGRLNREFPDQQFVDVARQEELQNELVSLHSTGAHRHVEQLLAQAQAAADDPLKAAQYLQDALRVQQDLIKNFPQSRFADQTLAETIETQLQTSLSRPVADEIKRQADSLAAALRNRHVQEARDNVAVLVQKVEHFRETFPRSPLLAGDVEQRLEYINFKSADLASIQEQTYGQLQAVPGQKTLQLFKEETPQALYQAVIGGNPSRNPGATLPVDSVSWADAAEFCRHLAWILARPVRLPTKAEFLLAVGDPGKLDVTAATWNLDNSGGRTHPVATKAANAAGFYDLLGNVAEWLDRPADEDDGKAPVIGGNAQTPVDSIRDLTATDVATIDRSRFTGFRFVVDTDEAAPLPGVVVAALAAGNMTTGGNTTVAPLPVTTTSGATGTVPATADKPKSQP